jgi:uncharacterized integral membrane protein (TIGR00698 family)
VFGFSEAAISNPVSQYIAKPDSWISNPLNVFAIKSLAITYVFCCLAFGLVARFRGISFGQFSIAFMPIFAIAACAMAASSQASVKYYGLEFALWAILIGLLISNTIGTPFWIRPALQTELYIKTGLVLLGAKVLFGVLMKLGPPGLVVAWVVTPIVLISTYWFGQRILKLKSRTLNIVISADMSVCGVSAAIATSAACRAKKEELSLAIGLSMAFTVLMMLAMPQLVKLFAVPELVAGAWIGGTIDSTGAVGAAGKMVGPLAEEVAVTIKMIQNVLIGVLAFGVALYWVRFVEAESDKIRPNGWEIWHRFPKFVIGFLAASVLFSVLASSLNNGEKIVAAVVKEGSEPIRDWFFALAFVSIGLESNFRQFGKYLRGGKPMLLYICGQSLNLLLTLLMAWLMFGGMESPH